MEVIYIVTPRDITLHKMKLFGKLNFTILDIFNIHICISFAFSLY